jgi:hypothetical protein
MAIVQIRHDTACNAYFRRRAAAGKTPMETLRALNDDCPMWCIDTSSRMRLRRAREDRVKHLRGDRIR